MSYLLQKEFWKSVEKQRSYNFGLFFGPYGLDRPFLRLILPSVLCCLWFAWEILKFCWKTAEIQFWPFSTFIRLVRPYVDLSAHFRIDDRLMVLCYLQFAKKNLKIHWKKAEMQFRPLFGPCGLALTLARKKTLWACSACLGLSAEAKILKIGWKTTELRGQPC